MIILKSRIKSMLKKQREKGHEEGMAHANAVNDINMQKQRDHYELKIMELESALHVMEMKLDTILHLESVSVEKDRRANEKMIQAQEIVIRVQGVLNTISDTAVRGKTDILKIRHDIEKPVQQIMEG